MGRKGSGVEVRESSIRLSFIWEGKPQKHRLMLNGDAMSPTPANVRYAHRLAAEIRDHIRHGTFSLAEYFPSSGHSGEPLTVGRQLDGWLATQRIEASTRAGYVSAIRFWKSANSDETGTPLGARLLRALKLSHIRAAIALRPDLSGKTVNNYVSVMREALQLAVDDHILDENPAQKVQRAEYQKDPPDPFSREEVEAIIDHMLAHHPEPIANMVEWRFFSGVRTSEMAGLRWRHVDLFHRHFTVSEAIVRGVEKSNTKTSTARKVLLNSRALAALHRQREHTQKTGERVWQDPRYGEPWREERAFRRSYWTPTLKRLGIRYRPPNNARHTYATMMLMAGLTPAFCAGQMGHSVEMFLRTYSRWLHGDQNLLEMQRLEAALSSAGEPSRG